MKHYFKLAEFLQSETARKNNIDNSPSRDDLHNLWILRRHVLDPLRYAWNQPIYVSSGYRSESLNKAVGGSRNSLHMYGMAADIYIRDCTQLWSLFCIVLSNFCVQELILYKTFIHIAYTHDFKGTRIGIKSDVVLPCWGNAEKKYNIECTGKSDVWVKMADDLPW